MKKNPSESLGNSEREHSAWGHGEHANMPKEVKMEAYRKASEYGPTDLEDTINHIDKVNKSAHQKSRSHVSYQH